MNPIELPKSWSEAKARGARFYFPGKFCPNGHMSVRLTQGGCFGCKTVRDSVARQNGKAPARGRSSTETKEQRRARYERDKDWVRLQSRRWKEKNKARVYARDRLASKSPHRRAAAAECVMRRYQRKKRATIAQGQDPKIKQTYLFAKLASICSGVPHEVDHVVPLFGRNVCGLHVPQNLVVVPWWENREKGNSYSFNGRNG